MSAWDSRRDGLRPHVVVQDSVSSLCALRDGADVRLGEDGVAVGRRVEQRAQLRAHAVQSEGDLLDRELLLHQWLNEGAQPLRFIVELPSLRLRLGLLLPSHLQKLGSGRAGGGPPKLCVGGRGLHWKHALVPPRPSAESDSPCASALRSEALHEGACGVPGGDRGGPGERCRGEATGAATRLGDEHGARSHGRRDAPDGCRAAQKMCSRA
mmetsp:Transcript_108770/g.292536  ORF Transcript_108770/g.292536 Transcript_108770/m.292536 type:complete len:211 (-) Transcript_108770:18-650(-)